MVFIERRDAFLIGLMAAAFAAFAELVRRMFDLTREAERSFLLDLLPALVILVVVFILYRQAKRHRLAQHAAAATAMAREAGERVKELEELVLFGQALTRALEMDELREALRHHLPRTVGSGDAWVILNLDGRWEPLLGGAAGRMPISTAAADALAASLVAGDRNHFGSGPQCEGHYCFPLRVGETTLGILGVSAGSGFTENHWQRLAALASLVAIATNNVQLFQKTRELTFIDSLTGCFNHAHALEVLDIELRRAGRSRMPLSIIMFDIDHFKQVNDRYGHLCGDAALVTVGRRLREILRNSDGKCRYGGEEFLLILPDTPITGAVHVAEWLRREIAGTPTPCGAEDTVTITASFGVASAAPGERETKNIIARADTALYQAKHEGRNCVRRGVTPPSEAPGENAGVTTGTIE